MWRDPDAHPNGRNGQAQNGVDIWGKNMFDNDYISNSNFFRC